MPPAYGVALQDGHIASHRSMQELLLDGDNICDIDTLNPSLTDLQLQGKIKDYSKYVVWLFVTDTKQGE